MLRLLYEYMHLFVERQDDVGSRRIACYVRLPPYAYLEFRTKQFHPLVPRHLMVMLNFVITMLMVRLAACHEGAMKLLICAGAASSYYSLMRCCCIAAAAAAAARRRISHIVRCYSQSIHESSIRPVMTGLQKGNSGTSDCRMMCSREKR